MTSDILLPSQPPDERLQPGVASAINLVKALCAEHWTTLATCYEKHRRFFDEIIENDPAGAKSLELNDKRSSLN